MNYPLPRLKRDNFLFIIIRMAGNKRNNQVYNSSYYLKCLHRDFSLTTQKGIKNKRYKSASLIFYLLFFRLFKTKLIKLYFLYHHILRFSIFSQDFACFLFQLI